MAEKTERVQVKMSPSCKKFLKIYADFYGMTMSEVLYFCARSTFHKQNHCCEFVRDTLEKCQIPVDKRAYKPCYGFPCMACRHVTACTAGLYGGLMEPSEAHARFLTPHAFSLVEEWNKNWPPCQGDETNQS